MRSGARRRLRWRAGQVLLGLLLIAGTVATAAQGAGADETTISVDQTRNAAKGDETGLGPSSISSIHQVFNRPVNGAVLAQPVVFGSTVIVATEGDWVYGFDRTTGDAKWARSVGTPEPSSATNCGDINPTYGITATPVVDPSTGLVYVAARTWDGANPNSAQQRIFAINVSTGAVQSGWPVVVAGTASNDPTTSFDASLVNQRTGLLLLDGRVYAGYGSMCDLGDYRGWVNSVSTTDRSQTLWSDEANPGGGDANVQGGIWQAGGGLAHDPDRPGSIFLASGNGTAPPVGPGSAATNSMGQSVGRLQVGSNGTLSLADHFTPFNADDLSAKDLDLGSSAPIMLPDNFGNVAGHPHLAFLGSKQGTGYLLDRDNLGGRAPAAGPDNALAEITAGMAWSHPASWAGDGGFIYLTTGPTGPVKAFRVGTSGSQVTLSQAGATTDSYSIFSGGPAITSNGTTSGSGVMWVVVRHHNDFSTPDSELRAYNATPAGGTFTQLASFPIGVAAKFSEPATDGGQVFLGTQDGHFLSFGTAPAQCTTYTSAGTGSHQVCGAIRAKYEALGGPTSFLGYPTTDETITPDGIGRFNHFSSNASLNNVNGSIYWTPNTGAWSIHGGIRAKWASLGWELSFLGYPVTDETSVGDGAGQFNHFSSNGSIYWTFPTGAFSIHGAIRAKYLALGGPTSFLGYPVTDELGTPDGIGRFNHFSSNHNPSTQDGSIYWTPGTRAWSVHGAIRARWASMGWERSCLGYPVSDEFAISGGRQSNFQRGVITYNFTTRQTTSSC